MQFFADRVGGPADAVRKFSNINSGKAGAQRERILLNFPIHIAIETDNIVFEDVYS